MTVIPMPTTEMKTIDPIVINASAWIIETTPFSVEVISYASEYTDEQFYADLRKASAALDRMAEEALEEDAQGKTREFPV